MPYFAWASAGHDIRGAIFVAQIQKPVHAAFVFAEEFRNEGSTCAARADGKPTALFFCEIDVDAVGVHCTGFGRASAANAVTVDLSGFLDEYDVKPFLCGRQGARASRIAAADDDNFRIDFF